MSAEQSRQFKGYTLKNTPEVVSAWHKDTQVGEMYVPKGTIKFIGVDPKHQEKGIASAMLKFGRQFRPIEHDLEANMTPSGRLWAQANP